MKTRRPFTHPPSQSFPRLLRWLQDVHHPRLLRNSIVRVFGLAGLVLVLSGVGYYLVDPDVQTLQDGLWLAFTTAATVGYGDLVPSTTASRVFSVIVVLMGLAVLSLVTATISAALVGTQERRMEHDILRDLHSQVGMLRKELAELRAQQERQAGHVSDRAGTNALD